jgi:uncharacterized membrane protein
MSKIATATASALLGALALAGATLAQAQGTAEAGKAEQAGREKCYGISAKGKNDCAVGAHSCAGQSTKDRDADSFVLLPAGVCAKIAGGSMLPGK